MAREMPLTKRRWLGLQCFEGAMYTTAAYAGEQAAQPDISPV